MVDYAQLVIGPPGSGKTTYCEGMHQLLKAIGRPHIIVNLDFANDWRAKAEYNLSRGKKEVVDFTPPDVDVRDLVELTSVMAEKSLGPNGGLIYCNKVLAQNIPWLKERIKEAKGANDHTYILFDMPGQVELYTADNSIHTIISQLSNRERDIRMAAIHLIDATLCVQPHQYLSALLISLSAQIGLELPFLNVLTKVDLLDDERQHLEFPLEYYARAEDLQYLVATAHPSIKMNPESRFTAKERKFAEFHDAICELVESYSLTSFLPLNIQDKESALSVLSMADQTNGFALSAYVPPPLRIPGSETAGDELRLPVDTSKKIFGSHWFHDFDQ